jgi:hypothetical protein
VPDQFLDRNAPILPSFEGAATIACAALGKLGLSPESLDFEGPLWSQQLVMVIAHLDAFVGDSVRAVCRARPDVLRRKKQVQWETVIACGNWDAVIGRLAEDFVYELSWKGLSERLEEIKKHFGLAFDPSNVDMEELERAEQARHLIMHNAGRVTPEYLTRTGRTDVHPGAALAIGQAEVERVAEAAAFVGDEFFRAISTKFFGKKPSDLPLAMGRTVAPVGRDAATGPKI